MPYTNPIIVPPIIAHRGASRYAPENTLASFLKAKQMGAQWIEFDVMLTSDNQLVVIHDEILNRTTNGHGYVIDHPYSYLKTLDAGSWFDSSFSGEKIPLLTEVIQLMREHHIAANIEIKSLPDKADLTAKKVLEVIHQEWTPEMQPPLISSFSLEALYALRRYDSQCWIGLLMDDWMDNWKRLGDELQCVSINVNEKILNPSRIAEIKSTHRLILSYTVNDAARAKELISLGVDAIYSDCPDILCKL